MSGESPRRRLLLAGVCAWVLTTCAVVLRALPLPFDGHFEAVLHLMWSGNYQWQPLIEMLFQALVVLCVLDAAVVLYAAAAWNKPMPAAVRGVVRRAYRYALALPLFALLGMNLGRFVANGLYALAPLIGWDLSPHLSALESPVILWLQRVVVSEPMSRAASFVYSVAWVVLVTVFGPVLVLMDRKRAVSQALVSILLISLLAMPFFLLLPVFDPWSLNPAYGYSGAGAVDIRYLYPDAYPARLSYIVTHLHWATGACLPSLHVAFPLLFALIARRHGLLTLWRLCLGFTILTAIAIVYLGRHWIIDIPASVPFCFLVLWLAERLKWDPTLELPPVDESSASVTPAR